MTIHKVNINTKRRYDILAVTSPHTKNLVRHAAYFCIAGTVFLISGCGTTSPVDEVTRADEIPMYAGIDRSLFPEFKAADEKFISDVTKQFGSRVRGSALWVNQGFKFYAQNQLGLATKRFNQAWLLNPKNSEVYAGFGSVFHSQGKNCEAMNMMEKALALNPPTFQGIYPDAAKIVTLCAVNSKALSTEEKAKLIARAEAVYEKAEDVEADKRYVYSSWATSYYWAGQYSRAWLMVNKARALGVGSGAVSGLPSAAINEPNELFLNMLRKEMAEPVQQ